jgi:protein-tyrosine phosphatase
VGAILDLCAELPATRARTGRERYRSLPVLDMAAPTPEQLADAISWIDTQRARGPVYVHCALGRSRSATVVAAWRMAHGLDTDPDQVEASLRDAREVVDLTAAQRAALDRFRVLLAR